MMQDRARLGVLVASSFLLACLPDGTLKYDGPTAPQLLYDGWDIASPQQVGLDGNVLAEIRRQLGARDRHLATLGVLIAKDGKLVWEAYLRDPADRDRHHAIQSVTKSVTSLAVGKAWDGELLPDLGARIDQFFPSELAGLGPERAGITIEQLLTMRSGLDFDNDVFSVEMWVDKPSAPLRHMLSKPLYAAPGAEYRYRDVDPQILGYLIQKVSGRTLAEYVDRLIFNPLRITDYLWEQGPDGVSMAAHGLHLRPRDLLKIGQLVVDGGAFQGGQLLSREFMELATERSVDPVPSPGAPAGSAYGWYFWLLPRGGAIACWGHGGNFIIVVPQRRLVVVQVAQPDGDLHGSQLADFVDLMAPLL